jgi:hypothetical protein
MVEFAVQLSNITHAPGTLRGSRRSRVDLATDSDGASRIARTLDLHQLHRGIERLPIASISARRPSVRPVCIATP